MSIAAPFFLWIAGAVAVATIAAHLLAWRRPPLSPLPTARFAPDAPARIVARAVRPTDVPLLGLRIAIVLLAGIALARPSFRHEPRGSARVVVLDHSRSVGNPAEAADSARAVFQSGDALVVFDSVAREASGATSDSIASDVQSSTTGAHGSISAALIAAVRAAERLARERDSVEIVLISPVTTNELDAATGAIRDRWPGTVRVIRTTQATRDTMSVARPDVSAGSNDAVAASLALAGPLVGGSRVRVRRAAVSAADSAWARDGGTLVAWPADVAVAGWERRVRPDTAYAVVAELDGTGGDPAAAVVASFERRVVPPPGRVVARWGDGDPAATEVALGTGCVRAVAVSVPTSGDLTLTPAFRRFARQMVAPCGPTASLVRASDGLVTHVLPAQPTASPADSISRVRPVSPVPSRLTAWLIGGALVLAVAEMVLRRGVSNATA